MQNKAIKKAIPLALGDSYHGFRIVGTNRGYPDHYHAQLAAGRFWQSPMQVVLGARVAGITGVKVGESIVGSHGLVAGGEVHSGFPYQVVGILAATGSVIDNLMLTGVESVWQVHEQHHDEGDKDDDESDQTAPDRPATPAAAGGQASIPARANADATNAGYSDAEHRHADHHDDEHHERQIAALLVQYSTPIAAALLPRLINSRSSLQAAAPAFETARLLTIVGFGLDTVRAFGLLLIATAALSVFIGLYNALKERRYDLAVMRTLGASRLKLLCHILLEGLLLAVAGVLSGLLIGHGVTALAGRWLAETKDIQLTGWIWVGAEWWLVGFTLAVGLLAALLPAIQAYRTDIAATLAKG